jgi:hypothetical protein
MHGLHLAAVTASFFSLTAGQQWVGCDSGICLGLPDAPSNATRSVNFKPFTNDTEWTWRRSNSISPNMNVKTNLRQAST